MSDSNSPSRTPSLGTPEGRRKFFAHLFQDEGQPLEGRLRALEEFFLIAQKDAYRSGWNDGAKSVAPVKRAQG